VPSASFTSGQAWWKPDVRTTHRIFASGALRSTKLLRSRSATALGVVVVPVHRFVGTVLLPPRPATS
jgi:hypothetical protein